MALVERLTFMESWIAGWNQQKFIYRRKRSLGVIVGIRV